MVNYVHIYSFILHNLLICFRSRQSSFGVHKLSLVYFLTVHSWHLLLWKCSCSLTALHALWQCCFSYKIVICKIITDRKGCPMEFFSLLQNYPVLIILYPLHYKRRTQGKIKYFHYDSNLQNIFSFKVRSDGFYI